MNVEIYLRPLKEDDARVSWRWRNNPSIWKYTGSDPSKYGVTESVERNWIQQAITDEKSVRFAICRKDSDRFVGIVDLRDIDLVSSRAEFNIFIIENRVFVPTYWPGLDEVTLTDSFERRLIDDLVCLPVDQNCEIDELKQIITQF